MIDFICTPLKVDAPGSWYTHRLASNDMRSISTNPRLCIFKPLRRNPSNQFDSVATIRKENKGITHYICFYLDRRYIEGLHRGYKG
jgi:hypothetical protein